MGKTRDKLYLMADVDRRNSERIEEMTLRDRAEAHMRARLGELYAMTVPPEKEAVRLQIIDNYEADLAAFR